VSPQQIVNEARLAHARFTDDDHRVTALPGGL